jgi:hypothetical protein
MSTEKIILIDNPKNGWSHMVSNDLETLHAFALSIGVKRHWFENKRGKNRPHYDIRESKLEEALENGAQLTTSKEIVIFLKEHFCA